MYLLKFILISCLLTSCENKNMPSPKTVLNNLSFGPEAKLDAQSLTKDFSTLPGSHEVSSYLDQSLSSPTCIPASSPPVPSIENDLPSNEEIDELCDFSAIPGPDPQLRTNNCKTVFAQASAGIIPMAGLIYTMKFFKANFGNIQDPKCMKRKQGSQLKNACQIKLNDMNTTYDPKTPYRKKSYFINFCAQKDETIVHTSYVHKGKGYCEAQKSSYSDVPGENTTSIGCFLTDSYVTQFYPMGTAKYKKNGWKASDPLCKKGVIMKGRCQFLRLGLTGLQESNNGSTKSKPMHTTPFSSSLGCPSVSKQDNWQLLELAKNGPSLVVNWGPQSMLPESSISNCKNENK